MDYRIIPPEELPEAVIKLPLSKSMSARALVINHMAGTDSGPIVTADCADTRALTAALSSTQPLVDIGAAGTAMRFLTALFAATPGTETTLTGADRMKQRPIAPLVDTLRKLGAQIEYLESEGFPPLKIHGRQLTGGDLDIDSTVSSQFISAILMVAPSFTAPLRLNLIGTPASLPYIDLTLSMMCEAGADAYRQNTEIFVAPTPYTRPITEIEADWSAAAFWYEIQAVSAGFFTLLGLKPQSAQGDAYTERIFRDLSVETAFTPDYDQSLGPAAELTASPELTPRLNLDLSGYPDLTPAIAVTCALTGIPFNITGLGTLPLKECDRLTALQTELAKIGVETVISPTLDSLHWDGSRLPLLEIPEFHTYSDHRMAMALAPVSLFIPGIKICGAECVEKSYPLYWEHLQAAGFTLLPGDTAIENL